MPRNQAVVTLLVRGKDLTGRALKTVNSGFDRLKKTVFSVNGLLAGLGISLAASKIVGFLTETNRAAEKLHAQLQTVTGSAENARKVFAAIEEMASSTPFQIENLAKAFVTLRTAGINPTEEMMTAFGDTASSFGKDITDFAEAVRAATTGEMERLKQFGIVARQAGDEVTFSFQGQTTTVKRNAQEIVGYLQGIAEENFAGAMQREMNTLNGAISNLKDNLGTLARGIGSAGLTAYLTELVGKVRDFTGWVAENRAQVAWWTGLVIGSMKATVNHVAAVFKAWKNIFEIGFGGLKLIVYGFKLSVLDSFDDVIAGVNRIISAVNKFTGTDFKLIDRIDLGAEYLRLDEIMRGNERNALELQDAVYGIAGAWKDVAQEAAVASARAAEAQRREADLAAGAAPSASGGEGGGALGGPSARTVDASSLATTPDVALLYPSLDDHRQPAATLAQQVGQAFKDATGAGQQLDELIVRMTDRSLAGFADAISESVQAFVDGSASMGEAFAGAMLGALSAVSRGFGEFFLAKATAALGEALTGNPAGVAAAAKYAAAASAMFALSGALAGASPGGGAGGSSASAIRDTRDVSDTRGEATVVLEGDFFLDSTDPRSLDRFARMMEEVSGRRVTVRRA